MDVLASYQVEGFADFMASLFAAVPSGFLLAAFLGLLCFAVGKLFGLLSSLFSR